MSILSNFLETFIEDNLNMVNPFKATYDEALPNG